MINLRKLKPFVVGSTTLFLPACPGDAVWTIEIDWDGEPKIFKKTVASVIISKDKVDVADENENIIENPYFTRPEANQALKKLQ